MSKIQRSMMPAPPGWFVVMLDDEMKATVQPVGAWRVVIDTPDGDEPTITCEPLVPHGSQGSGVLSAPTFESALGVFGPGQNPLPWAEKIEEWGGARITVWDVANWWPSQSPVFATPDEELWTADLRPMDGMAGEG